MEEALRSLMVAIIPLIFAITLHEAAHGWVAKLLGDKTAYLLGRVTANPSKHIDLVGTIIVPIAGLLLSGFLIGWAKPVPVTWQNLRHPRRDTALVALAGPAANFCMAFFWALIIRLGAYLHEIGEDQTWLQIGQFLVNAGAYGIMINVVLMIFNLLPLPPLDGSRILSAILPGRLQVYIDRIEPYGMFIILGLMVVGLYRWIIFPPTLFLSRWIAQLMGVGEVLSQ